MTLQEQLAQAEASYHNLITGQMARVVVDSNGERVEFTATTSGALARYIEQLKLKINNQAATGPLRVFF